MGILCNGQDDAVVLRRRSLVLMTVMVAIVFAAAMPLSLNVGDMMFRKLLEKMVHPMRCSRGDKKPKRDGEAQVQAASEFRDGSSGIHLVVIGGILVGSLP
jgi:hypothetical protein